MQRRQVLTAGATGCLGCLGGCSALDGSAFGGDRHPFADSTVSVRVDNLGTTAHDVETNAAQALDFWATESSQYTGFGINFEIVTEEHPDIIMAYVDTPEQCSSVENYSPEVLGCAPLLKPGTRVRETVTAYVVAADRPVGSIRTTAKHELGHILGLDHDAEPKAIMSNRPEDRIPLFEVRIEIWETVLSGHEQASTATGRLNEATEAWNTDQYDTAATLFEAAETAFIAARDDFRTAREQTAAFETEPPLETVDRPRLRADLELLVSRMAAAIDVASTMAEASSAAAADDPSTVRRLASEANDQLAAFHAIDSPEIRDIAVALGLVRGFARDDPVVEVDENEI